jgi:hypothetical protein
MSALSACAIQEGSAYERLSLVKSHRVLSLICLTLQHHQSEHGCFDADPLKARLRLRRALSDELHQATELNFCRLFVCLNLSMVRSRRRKGRCEFLHRLLAHRLSARSGSTRTMS